MLSLALTAAKLNMQHMSNNIWGGLVAGAAPGLQSHGGALAVPGGFDSHAIPPYYARLSL